MTQEAMKLALEALENLRPEGYWNKAITAIKEALAQTQEPKIGCVNHDCDKCKAQTQEPVAWMDADGNVSDNNDHKCFPIPLYTLPSQRTEQLKACVYCGQLVAKEDT